LHFFVVWLLSIALITKTYVRHVKNIRPMKGLIYYTHTANKIKHHQRASNSNSNKCVNARLHRRLTDHYQRIPMNIRINLILPETSVTTLCACCWQYRYGSICTCFFTQLFSKARQKSSRLTVVKTEIMAIQDHSRSFGKPTKTPHHYIIINNLGLTSKNSQKYSHQKHWKSPLSTIPLSSDSEPPQGTPTNTHIDLALPETRDLQ